MFIKTEIEEQNRIADRANQRLKQIKFSNPGHKVNRLQMIKSLSRRIKNPEMLMYEYKEISKHLNIRLSQESIRTQSEIKFAELFSRLTKSHISYQVWIANGCTDCFSYSLGYRRKDNLKGFTQKGIAFEIDGEIHNDPLKQKKDEFRDLLLLTLGILTIRIKNHEVAQSKVESYLNQFSVLCSNDRRRLKYKIALVTCLYHATDENWYKLCARCFGSSLNKQNEVSHEQ